MTQKPLPTNLPPPGNPTTNQKVLRLIQQEGPVSRLKIADRLGISLHETCQVVDRLIAEKQAQPFAIAKNSEHAQEISQTPALQRHAIIAIDLGGTKMFGALADLSGKIQEERYIAWEGDIPQENLWRVFELVEHLGQISRPAGQQIFAIVAGAPGITFTHDGVVTWAPSLGWRNLPLKQILAERFGLPVLIENDVNLAALGEFNFGAGKGCSSLVGISIGTGIGAGIVLDRKIYHGHHQAAGEVGYMLPGIQSLGQRYDDGFGALESIASGTGIALRARRRLEERGIPHPQGMPSAKDVFLAARTGEEWALDVVKETVDYLSVTVANVCSLLDPEIIVLGGGVARDADMLIEPILRRLDGVLPELPRLEQSTLDYRAIVMGAITLALETVTEKLTAG